MRDPPQSSSTVHASAQSRYAKYYQQPEGVSSSTSQRISHQYNPANLTHTSVNIATAFLNAQNALRNQSQQGSPNNDQTGSDFENINSTDNGYADESLEVNLPSSLVSSANKYGKRKRHSTAVSEDASSGDDQTGTSRPARKHTKKRQGDQENYVEEDDNVFRKPTTPARMSGAKTRRQNAKDLSYRPGQESEPDSSEAEQEGQSRTKKAPRVSTLTDGTKTPRVLGAYPTPGIHRHQEQLDQSDHYDDTFDHSSDQTARFRLDPPDPRDLQDDTSSTTYELENEHVRAREEAAARSRGVASAVLSDPEVHQHSSTVASGAGRSLPKPRRNIISNDGGAVPVPAAQKATRNRDLGFEPPPSDSDGFGPTGSASGRGWEDQENLQDAIKAGQKARELLLAPLRALFDLFRAIYQRLRRTPAATIFQGAALIMLLAVLIGWSSSSYSVLMKTLLTNDAASGSMVEDHSWLPWWSSKSKAHGTTFTAPELPATSFEQLVERLSAVERATSELSFQQRDQMASLTSDFKTADSRINQMSKLITQISDEALRLSTSTAALNQKQQDEQKHSSTTFAMIRNQLDAVSTRIEQLGKTQRLDATTLSSLVRQVETLSTSTTHHDVRLQQLTKRLEDTVKTERIAAVATEAIEQILPQRLAVRVDAKSGKVHIDPAIWRHLQAAFSGVTAGGKSGNSAPPVSWPAFLAVNEQSLRTLIEDEVSTQASSGAILNKQSFMDLLKREIKALKVDFEAKANENVAQIGQELLLKVDRQLQQHAAAANSVAKDSKTTTLQFSDGSNTTEVVQTLIDAALLQYSKDVLGRPDYALFTGGARVIPAITSPPLELRPNGLFKRALSLVSGGTGTIRGRPPVTALHPDLTVGSCWAFAGPTAQLGVRLSRKVVVSDVTIEHAARDVAYDVSTAPSDFEVWGIVESEDDARRLAQARKGGALAGPSGGEQLSSIPPSKHHMLLVTGTYDPNASHHIQSFPVFGPAASLDIPVSMVMLRILGTNGGGNGCLYRFRVGGVAVE